MFEAERSRARRRHSSQSPAQQPQRAGDTSTSGDRKPYPKWHRDLRKRGASREPLADREAGPAREAACRRKSKRLHEDVTGDRDEQKAPPALTRMSVQATSSTSMTLASRDAITSLLSPVSFPVRAPMA